MNQRAFGFAASSSWPAPRPAGVRVRWHAELAQRESNIARAEFLPPITT